MSDDDARKSAEGAYDDWQRDYQEMANLIKEEGQRPEQQGQ